MGRYTCDVDANQVLAARFKIMAIPTLLVLKDGVEVARVQGGMDKSGLLDYVKKYESSND